LAPHVHLHVHVFSGRAGVAVSSLLLAVADCGDEGIVGIAYMRDGRPNALSAVCCGGADVVRDSNSRLPALLTAPLLLALSAVRVCSLVNGERSWRPALLAKSRDMSVGSGDGGNSAVPLYVLIFAGSGWSGACSAFSLARALFKISICAFSNFSLSFSFFLRAFLRRFSSATFSEMSEIA
jgi:hypothetical protein